MSLIATVNKWGNAEGIRIPSSFCKQLGIAAGDKVSLKLVGDTIVIDSVKKKTLERYTAKGRLEAAGWTGEKYRLEEMITGNVGAENDF